MALLVISGEVVSGKGEGALFTGAAWARAGFQNLVAIDPWPGTLNLRIRDQRFLAVWSKIKGAPGLVLRAPDPAWCDGRVYKAMIQGGLKGAVVVPGVSTYAPDQVEIIAAVSIRETLGLADGDVLEVEVTA